MLSVVGVTRSVNKRLCSSDRLKTNREVAKSDEGFKEVVICLSEVVEGEGLNESFHEVYCVMAVDRLLFTRDLVRIARLRTGDASPTFHQ